MVEGGLEDREEGPPLQQTAATGLSQLNSAIDLYFLVAHTEIVQQYLHSILKVYFFKRCFEYFLPTILMVRIPLLSLLAVLGYEVLMCHCDSVCTSQHL